MEATNAIYSLSSVGEATLNTPLCTQLEKVELHQSYPRERLI